MKISGMEVKFQGKKTIILTDCKGIDHSLTLHAPNPAFADKLEDLFPSPMPPKTFLRGAKNQIERDTNGQPIMVSDTNNKEYLDKKRENLQLQSTAVIYEVLSSDKNISFDAGNPSNETDTAFYIALRSEIVDTFSNAAYLKLLQEAYALFTIDEEAISDAEKSFRREPNN